MEALLWLAATLILVAYLGYPLALLAWNGVRAAIGDVLYVAGRADRRVRRDVGRWPSLTVVFSAFDEAECIRQKIENCLALDYPAERLEILVGCDGCTDGTAERAREVADPRVRVVELSPRAGKASVLTRLVPAARGDVVILTDANVMLDRVAARALVAHFQDPRVGAVVGRLRLYNRMRKDYEESSYWKYETVLKLQEGRLGCVLGANGGLYAVRRLVFPALPASTIVDDFVVAARIAARGWRIPYAPDAIAYEETTEDYGREFERRARIAAGDWQALGLVPALLDPRNGFMFVAFVGHKLLRWTAPLWLALALAANAVLTLRGLRGYWALFLLQLGFYALALAGHLGTRGPFQRTASGARYFVSMNAALVVGFARFVLGTQHAAWQRTERAPGPGAQAARGG
jgi:cellulose synthase/poly-beta-1,6-N-acetylglucosamine synthase-like glycosyltransferase